MNTCATERYTDMVSLCTVSYDLIGCAVDGVHLNCVCERLNYATVH